MQVWSPYNVVTRTHDGSAQNSRGRFRARFTKALLASVRRRLSVEESFAVIFEQTLQEIPLTESEQTQLYKEMLQWAKESADLFPPIHKGYSPRNSRASGNALLPF